MRTALVALLAVLAGCVPIEASTVQQVVTTGCGSVKDFGALGDGAADDQPAVQAALEACGAVDGGVVTVPNGRYMIGGVSLTSYGSLLLVDNVQLRGESRGGAVLQQMPGLGGSRSMFYTDGAVDASITDLTLDGNKANQSVNTHRHGVFTDGGATRLRIERVTSQNFTGDGLYLYNGVVDFTLRDSRIADNDRNGLTMGATAAGVQIDGVTIADSQFVGNAAQQVDSEPVSIVRNVHISGCLLDALGGAAANYVMSVSGSETGSADGDGWTAINNRFNGPITVLFFKNVLIADNIFRNPTDKPAIFVYHAARQVTITGNNIENTTTTLAGSGGVVRIVGTSESQQPDDVLVTGNYVKANAPSWMGVEIRGGRRMTVTGNVLVGGGSASGYTGVRVRATFAALAVVVTGNQIRNFISGLSVVSPELVQTLVVTGNTFDDLPLVWP